MKIASDLKAREFTFTFVCGLFICFGIAVLLWEDYDTALWALTLAFTDGVIAKNARDCRHIIVMQDKIINSLIRASAERELKYSVKYPPHKRRTVEEVLNTPLGLN